MNFNFKKIINNVFGKERSFGEEKQELSEFDQAASEEKRKRAARGLAFNSGKNPLQEKASDVNYRMPKPKTTEAKKFESGTIASTSKVQAESAERKEEVAKKPEKKSKSLSEKLHLSSSWQAPKIIKTNLVKGEITTFIDWKNNLKHLFIVAGISVGVILVGLVFLIITAMGIDNKGQLLKGDIDIKKVEILKAQDDLAEIDKFQKKLKYSKSLLDEHIYWTQFFQFLENNIVDSTAIEGGFSGTPGGSYSFSLVTDSFETMTDQIAQLLSQPEVLSLEYGAGQKNSIITDGEDGQSPEELTQVSFSIDLVLDPKLFIKTLEDE